MSAGVHANEDYTQGITGGGGRSFKERQLERVLCPECGKELTKGSLVEHCQMQHGVATEGSGQEVDKEGGCDKPRTFRMVFTEKSDPRP